MKPVISIKDSIEKLVYLAWFMFFVIYMVSGRYHVSLRGILLMTIVYLFISSWEEGNAFYILNQKLTCTIWIIIFTLFVHISVLWQTSPFTNKEIQQFLIFDSMTIMCLELFFTDSERIKKLLAIYILSVAVYGTVVLLTMPLEYWGSDWYFGGITNLHRNTASVIFVVSFAIAIYLYDMEKNVIYLFLTPYYILLNFSTGSRKGIIQMVLIVLLYIFLVGDLRRKVKLFCGLVVIAAGIVLAFVFIPYFQETYGQRMLAIFDDSIYDSSIALRKVLRNNAFEAFFQKPILGNGIGYSTVINGVKTGFMLYSHCNYAELLCNYGIVGFLLYYSIYIRTFYLSFVNREASLGKLGISVIISMFIIEYGQVSYYVMAGTIPLYIIFISAVYGNSDVKNI